MPYKHLLALESSKSFISVTNKGKASRVVVVAGLGRLCPMSRAGIVLVNLVDREVLRIHVGLQLGLERRTNTAETIPGNPAEEWVLFDLIGAADAAKTMVSIANQTRQLVLASRNTVKVSKLRTTHRLTKSSASAPSC